MSKKYDKAFKTEVCRRIIDGKERVSVLARELGISDNTLYTWKERYLKTGGTGFVGSGNLAPEDAELNRLRRENRDLREENEILKKRRPTLPRTRSKAVRIYPGQLPSLPGFNIMQGAAGIP